MGHEYSETVQDDLGRWWLTYGRGATGGLRGSLLPISPWEGSDPTPGPFRTHQEADAVAVDRSEAYPHSTGVLWVDLLREAELDMIKKTLRGMEGMTRSELPVAPGIPNLYQFLGLQPPERVTDTQLRRRILDVPLPPMAPNLFPPRIWRGRQIP